MNEFETFNQCYPNSNYRLIYPQYTGETETEEGCGAYQKRKAPINDTLYEYNVIADLLSNKYRNNRVGWCIPQGYLVIDIDNKVAAAKAYTVLTKQKVKFAFNRTLHGGHFIFKDVKDSYQTAGDVCALGIKVDTRTAGKGYVILPVNDNGRKWGTITNDVDEVPFWLRPIKQFKQTTDLIDLGEGDGRNDALLKHFLSLMDYATGLTTDEKVESIKLINNFLFKKPLSEKELKTTVLRDSLIEQHEDKISGKKICLEEQIANQILEKYNIVNIGGVFYKYTGKYYKEVKETTEIERLIHFEYSENLKEQNRKEVIKFLALKSWVPVDEANKEWNEIVFNNGIYNIATGTLSPHDPSKYNTTFVPINYYDAAEYSGTIDMFFNTLCAEEMDKKALLYEIIGYTLIRKNIFSKFFVCYGGGGTGKSTYLKLIEKVAGRENTSYLSLQDLEDKWLPAELFGKLVNLGDDISSRTLKDTPVLKKATTGEMLVGQKKFVQEPMYFINYAKMIFACNTIPAINDTSTGLYRRMILINIDRKIDNPDPFFLDKLTDQDMEYLVSTAIRYVKEAIARGSLTSCLSSELALEKYRKEQSSVLCYLEDYGYTAENLNKKGCTRVYDEYRSYCEQFGYLPYKKSRFDAELCYQLTLDKKKTTSPGEENAWRYVIRVIKG